MAPTLLLRAAALAVLPLAASAVPAHAAPGDNGDVKVHQVGTPTDDQNDQAKVCAFYLDAFNFDTLQQVTWHIDQQPPTGTGTNLRTGQITLLEGHGFTPPVLPQLPDGHYELFWNFAGENGAAKHKVFEVDCAGVGNSPSPSPSASASASPSPVGGGTSPSPSASPSPGSSPGGPGGSGGPGRTPQGGVAAGAGGASRDWNPAEVTVGAALVAGAGFLVVRRRRRSRR
ncbi:hypothetical protein [Kitasatospora cineracea]|uniref:hypothetical protein n=1 Tax=Kitasatospora cineracea TaxID=88074 RepID=UPI0037F41AB4